VRQKQSISMLTTPLMSLHEQLPRSLKTWYTQSQVGVAAHSGGIGSHV
jgi:hypothetical protein